MLSEMKTWIMASTLAQRGQQRRIGRAESRTLGERDEEVIDKARSPRRAFELGALIVRDLHLWEKKAGAAKFLTLVSQRGTTAVQSPIPKRKHNYVREPEQTAGKQ